MNEAQVNGTQADEDRVEETQLNGDDAGDDGGVDVELLRRARLSAMLRELVRQEGKMEAAELLGVNYKTVARAEKSGRITGRMSDALERLLGPVDDPEAARLRERVGALEDAWRVWRAAWRRWRKELREGLSRLRTPSAGRAGGRAAVGDVEAKAEDEAQAQEDHGEGAGRSETRAAPPVAGLGSRKPFRERRLDPEIVTVEPAEDDAEVYGAAWPLVEEWRGTAGRSPPPGREPVVARDRGAAAHAGAGDAGGARADAAAGEAAPAGLRAQGPDQLALEGAGGHAGGAEKAEAAALGAAGLHPGTVAAIGPGDRSGAGFRWWLHRSYEGAT